jgi:hypothetical protein
MANPAFIFVNPTVTIGSTPTDVTCELSKAELTPNITMIDVGSLCGPAELPGDIKWTLDLDGFQAYGATDLLMYLFTNARTQQPFTLLCKDSPVGVTNPTWSGTVVCVPGQVGGTQAQAAVFTVSLPLIGAPTYMTTLAADESDASSSSSRSSVPAAASA